MTDSNATEHGIWYTESGEYTPRHEAQVIPEEAAEAEHVIDGGSCWCEPTVDFCEGGHIVIHNEARK